MDYTVENQTHTWRLHDIIRDILIGLGVISLLAVSFIAGIRM